MVSRTLVIGGGPIGAFSTYYLKKAGREVDWITGGPPSKSAAWASAGLVGIGLSTPLPEYEGLSSSIKWLLKKDSPVKLGLGFMLKDLGWFYSYSKQRDTIMSDRGIRTQTNLSLRSLAIFLRLIDSGELSINLIQNGILQIFTTKKVLDQHVKQLNSLVGGIVKFDVVDSKTCLEMEPLLNRKDVIGIFFPEEGAVDPHKFLESVRELNRSLGAEILDKKVSKFQTDGPTITGCITEDGERLTSDSYLVASGAYSTVVARSLRLKVPVVPAWGHSEIRVLREKALKRPVEIAERGIFISTFSGYLKLTSFFEFKGLSYVAPDDRFSYMERMASEFFPFISELKVDKKFSGARPCVPDSIPLVGKSSTYSNLFWATGNCRQGLMQSAETGRIASLAITGEHIPEEYNILSPARFAI